MTNNPEQNQDPLAPESVETAQTETQAQETPITEPHDTESQTDAQTQNDTTDYPKVVETLRAELAQMKDQTMRALAEAENARTRAKKDREDASKFAVSGFAKDLLSVADNLRRALDAVPAEVLEQHDQIKNLVDGIEATEREMLRAFEKNKIEKIDPKGKNFDPNFHEVMFEAPVSGTPGGQIIEVIEVGYALNGRLLRPARVGIAKDDGSTPEKPLDIEA